MITFAMNGHFMVSILSTDTNVNLYSTIKYCSVTMYLRGNLYDLIHILNYYSNLKKPINSTTRRYCSRAFI